VYTSGVTPVSSRTVDTHVRAHCVTSAWSRPLLVSMSSTGSRSPGCGFATSTKCVASLRASPAAASGLEKWYAPTAMPFARASARFVAKVGST
jgi:hypothetical protein